jgi:ATP-dependent RNA helicase DDX54/DBP10
MEDDDREYSREDTKKNSNKKNQGGFQAMGLSDEVYRGIAKIGFRNPTPVQRKSLPVILSGVDTVVMARTGSGKTAAFCIPLLERLLNSNRRKQQQSNSTIAFSAGAVILSPTRELSIQTLKVLQTLSSFIEFPGIRCIGINGGESMEKQFSLLASNPDVIVATPGRLAHHLSEIPDFHLKHCELVIFDEADRLFEMGFSMQIRQICSSMPSTESGRQTCLFSATMPKMLIEFTKSGIMDSDPQVVRLDKEASVSDELRIGFITVRSQEKDGALLHLLRDVLPRKDGGKDSDEKNRSQQLGEDDIQEEDVNEEELTDKEKKKLRKKAKKEERKKMKGGNVSGLGLTLIFAATRHHVDYLTALINNAGIGDGRISGHHVATSIYGSMDQDARKQNLSAFRSGRTPILIVTDVAARGIDIPLIDHVIHYSFPPTAKLFVHRSGRAARAGRIGYCWGLCDSEELPYLVDLYLFLGRPLATSQKRIESIVDETREDVEDDHNEEEEYEEMIYSVDEMTPDMVHYGSMPETTSTEEVENVRRIVDSELTGSHEADNLKMLIRTCENAMKQYRRSRPEASKQGVRRAKAILEGEKQQSGQRLGGGLIPPHPVLRKVEIDKIMNSKYGSISKEAAEKKLKDMKEREAFLRAMSTFRPKETIFEAFATGGSGKSLSGMGQVDKGLISIGGGPKKQDPSAAFSAMKSMRRQMRLAHDKGTVMVVAGSEKALELNGDSNANESIQTQQKILEESSKPVVEKKRLSKAERKKLKNGGQLVSSISNLNTRNDAKRVKDKRGSDFRDASFYIDNTSSSNTAEEKRSQTIEAAMQPSASLGKDGLSSALRLEEAMLDIVGDENADLVKNIRVKRWDSKKRKYIQTTLGGETSGMSWSKRMKLESGKIVKSDKAKLGELYEKWQKKTNKSIGRVGVFDDVTDMTDDADTVGYAKRTPKAQLKTNDNVKDDIKTATEIKKSREKKKKQQIKNMPKKERAKMFAEKRSAQKEMAAKAAAKGKGWQGKKGFSGRHGHIVKGR